MRTWKFSISAKQALLTRPLFSLGLWGLMALSGPALSQYDERDIPDLVDPKDKEILGTDPVEEKREGLKAVELDLSEKEELDDLESLKEDIGEIYFEEENVDSKKLKSLGIEKGDDELKGLIGPVADEAEDKEDKGEVVNDKENTNQVRVTVEIFDVGAEEQELLRVASFLQNKIPNNEWDEIANATQIDKYKVVEGDYLWKISKKLFGSGFYYPKIWSLNPYITNPHLIEPGMVLVFNTGDSERMPEVRVGSFDEDLTSGSSTSSATAKNTQDTMYDLSEFGDDVEPAWIKEKQRLLEQGIYVQYANETTYDDLENASARSLIKEYEKYQPPENKLDVKLVTDDVENVGFDKNSRVADKFKEGFYLNTFLTSNLIQDFGEISDTINEGIFLAKHDKVYLKFDQDVKVNPGDMFSIYSAEGQMTHSVSERTGYKYTITGQVKALRKNGDKWEGVITDSSGVIQRHDRITTYTPRISQILRTFNDQAIEAAILGSYSQINEYFSTGDVLYLDRGRADGVELGNVFEAYSFQDRGTEKKITYNPTYKIGEMVIITLTDNFATALVTQSSHEMNAGTLVISKTKEQAARDLRIKSGAALKDVKKLEQSALEELDVELNLDDLNDDLLEKADKIELSEDELEELERQEREKSIIKDSEKDLKALERLEEEIESAEKQLSESKINEDKLLESENLNVVEKDASNPDPNAFEALNEIEREVGLKYMDEDLNSKENPYGLTEYDLEEVDELLNVTKE